MNQDEFSFLGNLDIETIEALYRDFQKDPGLVDESWQQFFHGFELVAYISLSMTFYRASSVFTRVIISVYSPVLSESYKTDDHRYSQLFKESMSLTIFFQGIIVILLAALSLPVILLFVDDRYLISSVILQILLAGAIFDAIYLSSSAILRTSDNSKALLSVSIVTIIGTLVTAPILTVAFGVIGSAIAYSLAILIQGCSACIAIKRKSDSFPEEMLKKSILLKMVIWASIPAIAIGFYLILAIDSPLILVSIASLSFLIVGHISGVFRFTMLRKAVIIITKRNAINTSG